MRGNEMIKGSDITKVLGAALAAISMVALLAVPVGTASADPKEERMSRIFCEQTSRGNKGRMNNCTKAEAKARKTLDRHIAPRIKEYCGSIPSYFLMEKCVTQLERTSPEKMRERRRARQRGKR